MKNFLQKYKFSILKSLIVIAVIASIAVGVYFLLRGLGYTTKEDYIALQERLGDSVFFWLAIGALQVIQVIFIPITNQIITVPCALVFPNSLWKVWITSWLSIWLATLILYWIGRWGGKHLIKWILNDEEKSERCSRWLKRGWFFYPLGMLLPLPDDIITTIAGTAKLPFWFVLLCSFITRGIDTACSVYGFGYLGRFWWGWIILISGIILLFLVSFFLWKYDQKAAKQVKEEVPQENND